MSQVDLAALSAFVAVAEQHSFSKAAARLGIAPSTMSETIRALEERLGVRLLNRTTRSVALTEAGERLFAEILPNLRGIDGALEHVNLFRAKPQGTLRILAPRLFGRMLLAPLLTPFAAEFPEIRVEVSTDDAVSDMVGARFDAGIRVGHRLERDMTILRIGEPFQMIAVAAPSLMAGREAPAHPRDLLQHNCVLTRIPATQGVLVWTFARADQRLDVSVRGNLTVDDSEITLRLVLDGAGVGWLPEPMVATYIHQGRLVRLLPGWGREVDGVYLYHPSRRQTPMPLASLLRFIERQRGQRDAAWTPAGAGS